MRRAITALAVVVLCLASISRVHANEVRTPVPTAPTPAPSSQPAPDAPSPTAADAAPAEPTATPPADAPTGLVIHEIPPPPPNYGTSATPPAPTTTPPNTTAAPFPPPPPVVLVPPTPAFAEPLDPTKQRGYRTHDGFFFRGSLGLSSTTAFETQDGTELRVGGLGVPLTVAVGGVIAPNLALYGEIHGATLAVTNVTVDDETRDVARASISSLSVGASYYLMPHNFYFAGAIGVGGANVSLREESEDPEGSTGMGLALRGCIGKEWWVGSEWGIGIAAHVLFMSLPDGDNNSLTVLSVGGSASATYN